MRQVVGALILLAWAASLGWLGVRSMNSRQDLEAAGQRLAPFSGFYTVMLGSRQVGLGSLSTDTTERSWHLNETLALDLQVDGTPVRLGYRGSSGFSRTLVTDTVEATQSQAGQSVRYFATTDSAGSELVITVAAPLDALAGPPVTLPSPEPFTPASALPHQMVLTGPLSSGRSMSRLVFDPADRSLRLDRVTVAAESSFVVVDSADRDPQGTWIPATRLTIRGWRLDHAASGLPMTTWVDDRGNPLAIRHAFGMSWERTAFEIARNNYQRDIGETGPVVRDPAGSRSWLGSGLPLARGDTLAVLLGITRGRSLVPMFPSLTQSLEGGRQRLARGVLHITRTTPPADAEESPVGYSVHYPSPGAVGDSALRALALAVAGHTRDRLAQVRALARHVSTAVATDTSFEAPLEAGRVLSAGRAGADGKARLLMALARHLDIPARVVTGLAITPNGLLGHAWTEIWIDGWVAADPSTGVVPASPALLRFREGGRSRPADLVPLLGALGHEIVSLRTTP